MKKFFAALLAISITAALAGCNKPADGQTAEEIFSETVSETITTTTSEVIAETVSETKETTEAAESITEISDEPKNIFADYDENKFPMGIWQDNYIYTFDYDEDEKTIANSYNYHDVYDNFENYTQNENYTYEDWLSQKESKFYEFDGEGHYRISLETHDIFGEYTFKNNVLTLKFRTEFYDKGEFLNEFSFDAVREENGYRLYFKPSESSEMINLPDISDVTHSSNIELAVGLSALFDTFYKRESIFIEYVGNASADNFRSYIEYIDGIS